jgi:general L-amino acid transport system permease protein
MEQGRHPIRTADPLIGRLRAAAMAIEPRKPPSQFVGRLQRALGGRAGWSGFVVQLCRRCACLIGYEIAARPRHLQAQRDHCGFRLLTNNAGFDVTRP